MPKQKTIIHFVRHGEVENPDGIRYGRLPGYHLSARGRQQVQTTARFFTNRSIAHIYSSPLERCQQTATIIGLTLPETPITLDPKLTETKTGPKFEGQSRDLNFSIPDSPQRDAESKDDIMSRMEAFLEAKTVHYNGGELIAVTHGDPLALLYANLVYTQETIPTNFYPQYGSIMSFVLEGLTLQQVWYFFAPAQHYHDVQTA